LIDSLTASENTVKEMENEKYEEKLARINKVNQGLALLKQKLPSLEKEIELVLVNLKSANENLKVKEAEFFEIKDKLDLSNVRLFNEKTMELSICEKNIAAKEAEFQTLLMQIGGNESRLAQIEKEKEDSKTIFEDFKIYDSIKEAFSKNGIPALILKTQLPAINLEIEKILTGFDDFKITLETEYNSTNTLDVFITSKGTKKPIEICSGAEKMMASLAMRVALLNLSNLSKPDLFIVDESFGCLDQKNMPKVLQLLNLLKSRFKIVLVISHIPEIKEVADKIIEIKISNEESSIQA
jgi:exonuclease SbcC